MRELLRKMAQVANELDFKGLEKEANQVTMSMLKVAQGQQFDQYGNFTGNAGQYPFQDSSQQYQPNYQQQYQQQNQQQNYQQQYQQQQRLSPEEEYQKRLENDYLMQQVENLKVEYSTRMQDEVDNFNSWSQQSDKYFEASIYALKFSNDFAQMLTDANNILTPAGLYNLPPYKRKEYLDTLFGEVLTNAKSIVQKLGSMLDAHSSFGLSINVFESRNNIQKAIPGINSAIEAATNMISGKPASLPKIQTIGGMGHLVDQLGIKKEN